MVIDTGLGVLLVALGIALLASELVHPGALLFIPASVLLIAGIFYLFFPTYLLDSAIGPIAILVAAIVATIVELFFYRWVAPTHEPLTTTMSGLVGREGVVVAEVIPDTMKGKVRVDSEVWSARASVTIPPGTHVRVVRGEGVSIEVVPVDGSKNA